MSTENLNFIDDEVMSDSARLVILGRLSGVAEGSGVGVGLDEDSGEAEGAGVGLGLGLGDSLGLGEGFGVGRVGPFSGSVGGGCCISVWTPATC